MSRETHRDPQTTSASMGDSPSRLRLVRGDADPEENRPSPPDPSDLDAVFRAYSPYVARVAQRLLGDPSQVDDVIQEVFLAAMRGLEKVRSPEAVKSWLGTVTVRTARRRLRRSRLRAFVGLDRVPARLLIGDEVSPEVRAHLTAVYRVLDRLPTDDRIAWILRHVEGHNLEEVGALVGCSRATAHRRVSRTSAALTEAFRDS